MSKTLIKTRHGEYLIDNKTKTLIRTSIHEDAADLWQSGLNGGPGKEYLAYELVPIGGGDRLVVVNYADGTYSVSTTVQSVEEVDE